MSGWEPRPRVFLAMLACLINFTAHAQTLESLIMPGDVFSGHADVESECSSCHKPFNRSHQRTLCLDCHDDVAGDIDSGTGFHGKSDVARIDECATCHTDHEGRNADIVGLEEDKFDHALTDFELLGKHLETTCLKCHEADDKHRDAPSECFACHVEDDVHKESVGTDCGECHSATGWKEVEFDHDSTDYPLVGKHADAACIDCHESEVFSEPPQNCYGCHAADDEHDGRSGEKCETCHNPVSWTDTSFDHSRDTDFALLGSHARLTCGDCHSEDPFADEIDTACVSCHLEDDEHDGHHGTECEKCHTSDEWPAIHFDHDVDTDFRLSGAHRDVACADCHVEPIFTTSPGTTCSSCHLDDDPHDGKQGTRCDDCHTETSWKDVPMFDHDLTRFPLLGEHANVECDDCHETKVFADAGMDCVDCHRDDDPHDGRFEDNCQSCHNPVAWDLWLFDHNAQTDFVLDGAHLDVACDDCHRSSLASMQKTGSGCGDCHRADDVHDGEFGTDCGRCHGNESFKDVRSLR